MEESDGDVAARHNYKAVPNDTNSKWWLDPALRRNVYHCIGLCGTFFFNGYDGSLFNGIQTIDAWQDFFDRPSGNLLGLMNSSALFPSLFAPFLAAGIANKWGRRKSIWVGIFINVVGAIVNSAANGVGMYIAGRVILGAGISMGMTIGPILLQEVAHPRYRAQIGSMYTCIYYVASVTSAAVCLGSRTLTGNVSWRLPCYLQLFGPAATFVMTCMMPESPRWLAKNGREKEAFQVLVKYHANGDENDPLAKLEYAEILEALQIEEVMSQTRYVDYVKRRNRRRLFILLTVAVGTNWVGNGIISYYLSPILRSLGIESTFHQAIINLGLQIWNLIISNSAALSVDKVGRRPLWLTSTAGMLVSLIVVMGLSGSYATDPVKSVGISVVPFLFIFFGFYDLAWTPLGWMYTVEILPYNLRAKGGAIYNVSQGLANAVIQWVNPILLDAIQWKLYGFYIGVLVIYVVMIWFTYPETKGLTIEEIADIFDKDRAEGISQALPRKGDPESKTYHAEHQE